ncbi:MAG: IS200/IS605 family element transposase accessory protein TnpB [Dolichospermum sp. JUN01]|nr:IS200/IS605 family element transposase accessory protein TnpB [Dolichospermum sp. JUN01]MBS9392535.1 transposase [Dolichospermum sp. OL01]MCO5796176.1 IS200/IS605 family element transposase accessory protein TnpB [Dolichospermum sp. OL03]QSV57811.1 MAG: IS200/IS605 family element transposase accessory protein TnpB [Dolichospermum sp. LBC05a]
MYLTQKNQIRGLKANEFTALKELCRLSKNLYNVGLYTVRQYYFQERKHLKYESNYHYCKGNENYRMLNTDIAQQTLKVVDRTFRSFYGLITSVKSGSYSSKVRLPHYLPKEGYFPLIMPRVKVKDGKFRIPMSTAFKAQSGEIWIPFPNRLNQETLKEVRILPKYNGRFFEVEFISEAEETPIETKAESAIGIDLGLDNLATCIDTNGASFILDGKPLKSFNQWFNKENARLQSIKDLQKIKGTTERQARLAVNRNAKIRDYLNKAARYVINHCIEHRIDKLVVGFNIEMKQSINIGSRNHQNFVQIPHSSFRFKLKALCERYGIKYVEQEESYTSKASFLDNDNIPVFNADNPKKHEFSGKRIQRGLYRTQFAILVNADCNGAANILKKSKHNALSGVSSGCLAQPLRVKIS